MKILYVTQFFYPEITAAAFRAYEHCECWKKEEDVELTVYTGNPNYPRGELHIGYSNRMITSEKNEAYRIVRSKSIIKKNKTKLGRLVVTLSFLVIGLMNLIFNRQKIGRSFDVVLGTSGPVFAGVLAYIMAKVYRAPFIFEIRDITYIQMQATISKRGIGIKLIKCAELFLCKKANYVIVVTQGFKKELIRQGIKSEKISVIYNGVKPRESEVDKQVNKLTEALYLVYAGTIGISQDLEELIEFYQKLNITNKKLIIVGEGAEKQKIKEYIKERRIEHVELCDGVRQNELDYLLEKATFGVIKLKYSDYFSDTIPSKLFDLMNRGVPILYLGPQGEVSCMIDKMDVGITLTKMQNDKNSDLFKLWYDKNLENLDKILYTYSKNAMMNLTQYFDRNKLAMDYLDIIRQIHTHYAYIPRRELIDEYNEASHDRFKNL